MMYQTMPVEIGEIVAPRMVSDALRQWISSQLEERGLSAREASQRMGMGDAYLSQLLMGRRPDGRRITLGKRGAQAIATFFGVSPDFILTLEGKGEIPGGEDAMKAAMSDPLFKQLAVIWPHLSPAEHAFVLRSVRGLRELDS